MRYLTILFMLITIATGEDFPLHAHVIETRQLHQWLWFCPLHIAEMKIGPLTYTVRGLCKTLQVGATVPARLDADHTAVWLDVGSGLSCKLRITEIEEREELPHAAARSDQER